MKKTGLLILGALAATNAYAWNPSYACISNDAKKTKVAIATLDPEIVRTHQDGAPDRYYSVTDSSDELLEAMILAYKSGAHLTPVAKGTMRLTLTKMDASTVTASIKVGKLVTTFSCQ